MSVPSHHRGSLRARLPTLASLQALVLALLGGMAVALATSAAAHDTIIDAEPAHDAVLDTAPTGIVLTYSADILDLPAAILVTDSNSGEVIVEGEPTIQGQSVVLDLPALENGTYEVLWSVISSDGHRTEDTYNFTVAASEPENDPRATTPAEASSQAPTTQATPESTTQTPIASPAVVDADAGSPASGWPIGVVILLPIAVLGLALTAALIYRRRRQN